MPQNLFAACRVDGSLTAKRVRLDQSVQQELANVFSEQEQEFREGVTEEVTFDGRWKPEEDEVLVLDIPQEAQIFIDTIQSNPLSVPELDTANFNRENIRALFTGTTNAGNVTVYIQQFSPRQMLSRARLPLVLDGNAFRHLSDPAFSLDRGLTCIIEDGKLKFKSFHKMRAIVDLVDTYKAATDEELRAFAAHSSFEVADATSFLALADQTTRKLIHAIARSGTLDEYTPAQIEAAGNAVGICIATNNGKVVMPTTRAEIKKLLRFLDDGLYEAPLTGQRYITNSKRPA